MRVMVTGGSRGIGKAIVKLFEDKGHYVYSPAKKELNLNSVKIALACTNFDVIVNNAGINILQDMSEINENTAMRVNYFSPLQIIQQIIPNMVQNSFGRIVNIGSVWINQAKQKRHAYSASKSALHSLTKSIASEYSEYNILANTISPGFIETDLTRTNNTNEELNKIKNSIPLKRLGQTNEIAELVYFLSVSNSYITGQNIVIDGGFSCTRN